MKNPSTAWPYSLGTWCIGARRIRLTPEQRRFVHASWPADRPRFWGYKTESEQRRAWLELLSANQRFEKGDTYNSPSSPEEIVKRPEIYPMLADDALAELNKKTPKDDAYIEHIFVDPSLKGFKYMDFPAPPALITAFTNEPASQREGHITCKVGEYSPPTSQGCRQAMRWVVFDGDEFAIIPEPPIH